MLWVAHTPERVQINRLMQKRGLSQEIAMQRIAAQPSQQAKILAADVVIRNDGTFEDTWQQVLEAWRRIFPTAEALDTQVAVIAGSLAGQRGGPRQAAERAEFITRITKGSVRRNKNDIMEAFGEKAYLMLKLDGQMVGVAGWQVENLVARTDDIYLHPGLPLREVLRTLTEEIERESRELQCEIALVFLSKDLLQKGDVWRTLGYQTRTVQSLGVRAWQEAAMESLTTDTTMFFKQLRKDRVLRPV